MSQPIRAASASAWPSVSPMLASIAIVDAADCSSTAVAAVLAGAHIVRVHAVKAAVEAMAVADAVLRARG